MSSRMSSFQAALRFLIEMAALAAWATAVWRLPEPQLMRWVAAVLTVLGLSALWATFRVPGDASASGGAPFAVAGPVRLGLELLVLLGAGVALAVTGSPGAGLGLAGLVVAHYVATRDRVRWLLDDPARSDGHPSPRQDAGSRPTS